MKITLTNNIHNRNNQLKNNNKPQYQKLNTTQLSVDSFQLSQKNNIPRKAFFTGRTQELPKIAINSVQDIISQWEKMKYSTFYEAHDDRIFPENKATRMGNFAFFENIPNEFKQGFIDHFKSFTSFPNFQKVSRKIQNEFIKQVQDAATNIAPNSTVKVVVAGFDPTSSVGMERPFPGSDLDKAYVVLQNQSHKDDFKIIDDFKSYLWYNTDQRILSLNNENTFPEVYTTNFINYNLYHLDMVANNLNMSPEDKIKILIASKKETDPVKAGIFNIEIAKHLPFNGITKYLAKNFAYFIESIRDGRILVKDDALYNELAERMNNSTFCTYSNVAQIGAKYTSPLKTKLQNREELTENFDKLPIDEQLGLIREMMKSVSDDNNNPVYNRYFKNDYDIGASYNRLNKILIED